jgi:hypothetical protein
MAQSLAQLPNEAMKQKNTAIYPRIFRPDG